jgi:2-methylcitrate dehydratase PrpD
MAYIGAKVLLNGFIDLAHYRPKELTDPATHKLAKRIRMISDNQTDPNSLVPVKVELKLTNGQSKSWMCEQLMASPARRLTREEHLKKFRRCWEFAVEPLPAAARESLIKMVDELENLADVRTLSELLVPPMKPVGGSAKL